MHIIIFTKEATAAVVAVAKAIKQQSYINFKPIIELLLQYIHCVDTNVKVFAALVYLILTNIFNKL